MATIQFDQKGFDHYVSEQIAVFPDVPRDEIVQRAQRVKRFYNFITCSCGAQVFVAGFTNRCDCGKFYNWAGQQLSHPRFWGEETGERFDDDGQQIL